MATIREGGYPYFVSESSDKRILGYAYAGSYRPRIGYNHVVEDSVYVAPDAQRRGVGRALLRALIAEAEALGFRQMVAVIGDSRLTGSIALHQGQGFAIVARMPTLGHKFGLWLDTVLMQRALGPGAGAPPARPLR
jgi:phosphinothricin acetyltransferase